MSALASTEDIEIFD
jgi:hypothetical protein